MPTPGIHRDLDGDGVVLAIQDKRLTIRATGSTDETIIEYAVLDDGPAFGRGIQLFNTTEVRFDPIVIEGVTIRPNAPIEATTPVAVGAAVDVDGFVVEFRDCRFEDNRGLNYIQCGPEGGLHFTVCDFEDNGDILVYDARGRFDWCTFTRCGTIRGVNDGPDPTGATIDCLRCEFHDQGTSIRVEHRSSLIASGCQFWGGRDEEASIEIASGSMASIGSAKFHAAPNPAIELDEANLQLTASRVFGHPLALGPRVRVAGEGCDALDREYQIEVRNTAFSDCVQGAIGIASGSGPTHHRVLVKWCEFIGNTAVDPGAAISVSESSLDVDHCTFSNNDGGGNGDAIAISGDARGFVRIMHSMFTDNGSGGTGVTVFNDGLDQVQCFENRFCGDAGEPLGGSAMGVWSNLLAGACWDGFPNPRGISELEDSPVLEVTTEVGPELDHEVIAGDVGRTAFAESLFEQSSFAAAAVATATVEEALPTEHGIHYTILARGEAFANSGGIPSPASARSSFRFMTTIQVFTEEPRYLDLTLASEVDSVWRMWDTLASRATVRRAGGDVVFPSLDDTVGGRWEFELDPGRYSIELEFECSSEVIVSGTDSGSKIMDQEFTATIEFLDPAVVEEDGEETDDEDGEGSSMASDLNKDGRVDGADLAAVLQFWGTNDVTHDINRDGVVDGGDFAAVLAGWQ